MVVMTDSGGLGLAAGGVVPADEAALGAADKFEDFSDDGVVAEFLPQPLHREALHQRTAEENAIGLADDHDLLRAHSGPLHADLVDAKTHVALGHEHEWEDVFRRAGIAA